MPRRPNIPSFCNGRDTIVYQLNGCNVQNYRVYIGNLYVRQLNDDERRELDEYEYRLREYQNGLIENLKKPSAPSWRSSIENQQWNDWHSWAPFRKYANANANMTIISNPETSTTTTTTHRPYVKVEASTITTTNEPITSAQTTTEVPIFTKGLPSKILTSVPPKPPKFCSQIY
uniref:Pepsin inhibitor-3-like repeated domain-containing protein n=1 Tax=Acrobeloides nanus TaxID=290746 RepID=A0A914D1F9_9BILA